VPDGAGSDPEHSAGCGRKSGDERRRLIVRAVEAGGRAMDIQMVSVSVSTALSA